MRWLSSIAILLALALAPAAADAEIFKQRGGSAFTDKIGPWHIFKAAYDDGSSTCWAYNPNYGRRDPTFSYMAARGGKAPQGFHGIMRFDSRSPAAANETVTLVIGAEKITLHHSGGGALTAFTPRTVGEARQITNLLLARENAPQKSFFVVDRKGNRFRYDARSTSRMLRYMEDNCGYKRF